MKAALLSLLFLAGLLPLQAESSGDARLPRLIDLGAGKCIPCKKMKPILEELTRDYATQFQVTFIDVWENREAGEPYKIRMIPTQIFLAADGRELFRHEGYYSKKDILGKWRELGLAIQEPATTPAK